MGWDWRVPVTGWIRFIPVLVMGQNRIVPARLWDSIRLSLHDYGTESNYPSMMLGWIWLVPAPVWAGMDPSQWPTGLYAI